MMDLPEGMSFLGGRTSKEMYVIICKLGLTAPDAEGLTLVNDLGNFIQQFLTELEVDQARAVAIAELETEHLMGINFVNNLIKEGTASGQEPSHMSFITDGKRWY